VFLAGGIGISPIRSILRKAAQERLPHRLYLFYPNREADNAAFVEEFEDLTAQNSNFTFIPTFTGHRTISWPYEKGYIDREMLTRYLLGLNLSITSRASREWSLRCVEGISRQSSKSFGTYAFSLSLLWVRDIIGTRHCFRFLIRASLIVIWINQAPNVDSLRN
jgi:hypothetical protein